MLRKSILKYLIFDEFSSISLKCLNSDSAVLESDFALWSCRSRFPISLSRFSRTSWLYSIRLRNWSISVSSCKRRCSVLVCCSLSRIRCSFSIFNFSINRSESRSFFSTSRSFSSRVKDSVEEDFFSASRRWMISSRSFVDFSLVYYFLGKIT